MAHAGNAEVEMSHNSAVTTLLSEADSFAINITLSGIGHDFYSYNDFTDPANFMAGQEARLEVEGLVPDKDYNLMVGEYGSGQGYHAGQNLIVRTLVAPLPKYVISPREIERRRALEPDHNASVVTESKKEFE
jgi:hypothetical protein